MSPVIVTSRRRQIVLGAFTVLLHLLVLDWLRGQAGRPREPLRPPAPPLAATLLAAPETPPAAPVPPPHPALLPPPLPPLPIVPFEVAQAVGGRDGAGDAVPAAEPDPPAASPAGVPVVAAGQQAPPAATTAAMPAPNAASEGRRYKVDLPPPAEIRLDVARTDANGAEWRGEATLSWTRTADAYQIRIEAGITVVFAQVNLLTLTSEGRVGEEGFMPELMTEKRRGRAMTATHFDRNQGRLSFSASSANYPLAWGAQDKASLPLQLTAIARGDPRQLSENIDILVGEDRDASVFSFVVLGEEHIETRIGTIAAWHLVRPPKPGSYNSRLELWLAPGYGWVPVQIRNLEASGAVTTQTVNHIVMKNAKS